ncbi:MAG: GNAT family N-acetyltransferase [Marinifilaceae bacterium]|nr:GNAT family N-acetyltransferase [Marinifilaceae bacterium]
MITDFIIRKAEISDAISIVMLKIQVWLDTYATGGINNEYAEYLASEITKEKTEAILLNPNKKIFLVEKDSCLIACSQLDYDTSCPIKDITDPELSVLYVSRHFHGQGIGSRLLVHAEEEVEKNNGSGLWLTAYYQNQNALDFYHCHNYLVAGKCFFEMGENQYENWVFNKKLKVLE